MARRETLARMVGRIFNALDILARYRAPVKMSVSEVLSKRGVVRWGDGESCLMLGIETSFQKRDATLARDLRKLIASKRADLSLCVPTFLLRPAPFDGLIRARTWLITALILRVYCRSGSYGDAFLFRNESGQEGRDALLELIANCRSVVIASSNSEDSTSLRDMLERRGLCEEGLFPQIRHINVPKKNAYAYCDRILVELSAHVEPSAVLLACGPVGKILIPILLDVYPESKIVDIGHLFEHDRAVNNRELRTRE